MVCVIPPVIGFNIYSTSDWKFAIGIYQRKLKSIFENPSCQEDNKVKSYKNHKEIFCAKLASVCYFVGVGGYYCQRAFPPPNVMGKSSKV